MSVEWLYGITGAGVAFRNGDFLFCALVITDEKTVIKNKENIFTALLMGMSYYFKIQKYILILKSKVFFNDCLFYFIKTL